MNIVINVHLRFGFPTGIHHSLAKAHMRNLTRVSVIMLSSAAMAGAMVLPASAAQTTDTITTVTVEAGELSITAPAALALTAAAPIVVEGSVPQVTATGVLPGVTVSDLNADGLPWASTVSVSSLVFGENVIPAEAVTFSTSNLVFDGTSVVSDGGGNQTATGTENSTASWDTNVSVVIPADALAGDYEATVTNSVF